MAKKSQAKAITTPRSKAEAVARRINEEYYDKANPREVIFVGSQMRFKRVPRIPTGCFALDLETGGGWPRGRLNHLYGRPSTGKSFLAYKAIAEAQKLCQWCSTPVKQGGCDCGANDPIAAAWIDVEHTDSAEWRQKIGIDPDLFLYVPVEYGEEAIDYVSSLVRQPEIGIIAIDSIAAMSPAEIIEKSASDGLSPGALARIVTRGTRAWQAGLNVKHLHPKTKEPWDNLCTIFALNQLRDVINSSFPMPPQPPGGHALRHMASIELKLAFANADFTMEGDKEAHEAAASSVWINFITEKNKVYSPRRMGSFQVNFADATIDNDITIYDYAKRWGIIEQAGAWYTYGNTKVQGEDNFYAALYENGEFPKIRAAVWKKANEEIGSLVTAAETGPKNPSVPMPKEAPKSND
jgi:recombination protein RecA